jgi:signal transduction histidine kinase
MLRRLVPHSMMTWFVLVLAAGIALSLIAVSAFHALNRDEAVAALEDLRAAERIAAAARFLDHSSPVLRPVIADSISGSSLDIVATTASGVKDIDPPDARTERLRDVIAARLRDLRWRDLRVDYGADPDESGNGGWSWLPSLWNDEGKKSDQILTAKGQNFTVSLQLLDGTWLNFSFASVRGLPFSSWSHLLLLAAGIAAVMVLGIAAMRLITRPIEGLAIAAEELGKGLRPGDVPEAGLAEVRSAARAFNRMQRRIRRMIEDRTQMIAAISHDLRTPITRLRLRAEFVEDPEEQQKMLADLDQMEAIIRSTLAFARADNDAEPTSAVDLVSLLRDVADGHPPARFSAARDGHCILRARPVALRRCFDNLVANAVRYGSSAEIAIRDLPDAIEVTIEDTGPGIPAERLKDVFRPFVRLEGSRNPDSGGVGLGLAIARSVVLAHGGTIALSNRAEGGLRATVRLPKGE